MSDAQLRAAIAMPARAVGVGLDPGLLERIVADVDGQPGALPIVQHALALLWKHRSERCLTLAAYESIGGVAGALERHADGHIARLDPAQLRQARRILVRLAGTTNEVGPGARRRLVVDKLRPVDPGSAQAFRDALQSLARARLVVLGERSGPGNLGTQVTVELVHDALLHRWARLRGWVLADASAIAELDKLELWALEWQEHGHLLDERRLAHAVAVAEKHRHELSAEALELIERSSEQVSAIAGKLGATQELLIHADADGRRARGEIVRLRRYVRTLAITGRCAGG